MRGGCSWQIVRSDSQQAHVLSLILKLFFDDVFQCPALQTESGKHLFEKTIFVLNVFHLFDIIGFHATVLCFSAVVRGFRYSRFVSDIFDGASGLDGLKNGDDLVFGESGFTRGDLLAGT
jgi:hypothetical protein